MSRHLSRRAFMEAAAPALLLTHAACRSQTAPQPMPRTARGLAMEMSGVFSTDGAGVRLRRSIGANALPLLDPFLLLDEIHSDVPDEFVRGFPRHPHRGFETVTYMLEGALEHRDSVGNQGLLGPGSAQWMTAGRGIIHSEMPRRESSSLWGLQLWVNLPSVQKMTPPRYQDIAPSRIPEISQRGCRVRVVAGAIGSERGPVVGIAVEPSLFDVELGRGATFEHDLVATHTAFTYVLSGSVTLPNSKPLTAGSLGVLGPGDALSLTSRAGGRALVIAGRPLNEPVARRGPFVMNTQAELQQAFADYQTGRLTSG